MISRGKLLYRLRLLKQISKLNLISILLESSKYLLNACIIYPIKMLKYANQTTNWYWESREPFWTAGVIENLT